MSPPPNVDDIEAFNKLLLQKCDEDIKREHYSKNPTLEALYLENKVNALYITKRKHHKLQRHVYEHYQEMNMIAQNM